MKKVRVVFRPISLSLVGSSYSQMALCGVSSTPNLRSLELLQYARSSSIALKRNRSLCHPTSSSYRAKPVRLRCSSSNVEMEEDVRNSSSSSVSVEDESSAHVMQFKWNDFKILDRVSIGHGGRADELVFEAVVQVPDRSVSYFK